MATRTWNSSGSTNANDGNNYTPTGALLSTDDIVLNGTSVVDWDMGTALSIGSITITAAYTGDIFITNGTTINNAAGIVDDGITGTHYYEGNLTFSNASASLHIGASTPVYTLYCNLLFNGTTGTTLDIDRAGTYWGKLTTGASAKLTVSGAAAWVAFWNTTCLSMGNNGTLTINQETVLQCNASTNTPYSIGSGCTINGNSWLDVEPDTANLTIGLPALTMGGSVGFFVTNNNQLLCRFNQLGNISIADEFQIDGTSTNGNGYIFDHNDFNVTCTGDYVLDLAASGAVTQTVYMGNGTFQVKSIWFATNGGIHQIIWENSRWTATSNMDINATCVHTPGTAIITQTLTTGGSFWTQNGGTSKMPTVILNAAANTFTLYSNVYTELFDKARGTFSYNGYSVFSSANYAEQID